MAYATISIPAASTYGAPASAGLRSCATAAAKTPVNKPGPIMPPMPWQWFSKMTDRDLKSIYAYLRTIPPVSNTVPDYEPPAPAPQPRPARVISLEPCGR